MEKDVSVSLHQLLGRSNLVRELMFWVCWRTGCFLSTCAQVPSRVRMQNIVETSVGNSAKSSLSLSSPNQNPAARRHSQDQKWYTNASSYSQGRRIISDIFAL